MINHNQFFVCGSFCEGMVNFSMVEPFVHQVRSGKVKGRVVRVPVGFPAMLEGGDQWVDGQLITLKPSSVLLALLDEFHGFSPLQTEKNLHFKKNADVVLKSGEEVRAFRYVLNPKKMNSKFLPIEGNDWQQDLQQNQPIPNLLTPTQINYIKKLRDSKGRDIVPIQLDVYRQLMGLELIVDKGRRLALSKLGKETCKFLS